MAVSITARESWIDFPRKYDRIGNPLVTDAICIMMQNPPIVSIAEHRIIWCAELMPFWSDIQPFESSIIPPRSTAISCGKKHKNHLFIKDNSTFPRIIQPQIVAVVCNASLNIWMKVFLFALVGVGTDCSLLFKRMAVRKEERIWISQIAHSVVTWSKTQPKTPNINAGPGLLQKRRRCSASFLDSWPFWYAL